MGIYFIFEVDNSTIDLGSVASAITVLVYASVVDLSAEREKLYTIVCFFFLLLTSYHTV